MNKTFLRASCLGALALAGVFPASAQTHPWPMRNANAQRTGQSGAPGAVSGALAWRVEQPGTIPQFAASNNGEIILGPTFNGNWWSEELFISAYRTDGAFSWRKKLPAYQWGFSQGLKSSPALDAAGNLVTTAGLAQLIKFTPDIGSQLWMIQGSTNTINDFTPIVADDGSIRWAQAGTLRGISSSGASMFNTSTWIASVAMAPNGDMAGVHGPVDESQVGPTVTYFYADGTLRWEKTSLGGGGSTTPVFGPDGTLYVTPKGGMFAYNPDGTTRWFDPNPIAIHGPALGSNGQVYSIGSSSIRAYNKDTGAILWTSALPGTSRESIAIDSRGVLYITTSNGYLVSMSAAGNVLWQTQICTEFTSGPIIALDGLVVAAGKQGFENFVYAIR